LIPLASIEISEERGVRYLHFGSRWIQGAMRIARPWSLELDYTRAMMTALLLRHERGWPRTVLQIGLGAASITRFLYRNKAKAKLVVVEISPAVITTAWQFFKLPDNDARLAIEIGDGHTYMATTRRQFDLILIDGFDAKGRAGMLDTLPFYCNCRARLASEGMLVTNLLTRRRDATPSVDRLRTAFADRVLELPPSDAGNIVALSAVGAPVRFSFDELRSAARKLKADTGLNLSPTVARLLQARGSGEQLAF
jgi:spermidine synthase